MRNSLQVGDEIVTIGGICGKIVKTKDDTIVIQVGADKVKFEMMRWAVSSVTSSSKTASKSNVVEEDEEEKKIKPKKLRKDVYKRQVELPTRSFPLKVTARAALPSSSTVSQTTATRCV